MKNSPSYKFRILPFLILAVGLAITWLVWTNYRLREAAALQSEFQFLANKALAVIENRLHANEQVLRGVAGLFAAGNEVNRKSFRVYVETLHLEERYPGIQAIGFMLLVQGPEKTRHERQIRNEGFPGYAIRPIGVRAVSTPIIYVEPFSGRNLRAFGYDTHSEPVRRTAMDRACVEGQATLSGKVTLVQETENDIQAGFLLFVPVYRNGAPHATVAERRSNLIGWTYSALRMKDMMRSTLSRQMPEVSSLVDLHVYDGTRIAQDTLMFDSEGDVRPQGPTFEAVRQLQIAGHVWTIRVQSLPKFDVRQNSQEDTIIPGTGIALSVLLALLTWVLVWNREQVASALVKSDQANRDLAVNEERFRAYFDLGLIGMAITSPHTGWLQVNDRLCEMLGWSREELIGKTWVEVSHPDDITPDNTQFQRVVAGEIDGYALEKRFIRKDGSVVDTSLSLKCQRHPDGSVYQFVALIDDISERKYLESILSEYSKDMESLVLMRTHELEDANRELELRRDQAESANRAKSMFLAIMSHELRTPLNSILGLSEILLEGIMGDLNEKQLQGITTIEESGRHLLELITDILDLSKIEADMMDLDLSQVNLEELCRTALRFVRESAQKKRISVTFTLSPAPESIRTDQRRLKQILINLLGNAVKFTPNGGAIGLEVAGDEERGEIRFTVWDTGIGIAPEDLKKLFKPFVQVDSSLARRNEGTGLGLTLVARLTEILGGAVAVDSEAGTGSRFTVILPCEGPRDKITEETS